MKLIFFFIFSTSLFASESRFGALISYSLYDMWLPAKYGGILSYGTDKRNYELAYEKSSIGFGSLLDNIGSVSDERLHLTTRSFKYSNSFNYQYGISYNRFAVNLGKAFVNTDVFEARTLDLVWGIGNRWKIKSNIEIGVDWLRVFYPVKVLSLNDKALDNVSNKEDKEDLENVINLVTNIPKFTIFHFEVGYRF